MKQKHPKPTCFLASIQFSGPPPDGWEKTISGVFEKSKVVVLGNFEPVPDLPKSLFILSESNHANPLSQREMQVLEDLAEGLTNKQIAQKRFIAAGTVHRHTRNIYLKMGVPSRTAAVSKAHELKILGHHFL